MSFISQDNILATKPLVILEIPHTSCWSYSSKSLNIHLMRERKKKEEEAWDSSLLVQGLKMGREDEAVGFSSLSIKDFYLGWVL